MKRGSTPTHIFTIPFDTLLIDDLRVSYAQNNTEIVVKNKSDCELEGQAITVNLSQEDTLKFSHSKNVELQIKVLTTGGEVHISDIIVISVGKVLNSEVLQ